MFCVVRHSPLFLILYALDYWLLYKNVEVKKPLVVTELIQDTQHIYGFTPTRYGPMVTKWLRCFTVVSGCMCEAQILRNLWAETDFANILSWTLTYNFSKTVTTIYTEILWYAIFAVITRWSIKSWPMVWPWNIRTY